MKTRILITLTILTVAACGGNKEAKLEVLKKQRDKITGKIEKLETEIAASSDSNANIAASTFVSIEDMQPKAFNHYIEVQGKLDGDENLAISPEAMGNVV
jgi:hypothetical protein